MLVVEVDERDSNWERDAPRFRVYLHPGARETTRSSTSTYDITGADVLQVIDWAQRRAAGGVYAVALVAVDAPFEALNPGLGRGLVWLVGRDGNDWPDDHESDRHVFQRMLDRRTAPVGIPEADRAPVH